MSNFSEIDLQVKENVMEKVIIYKNGDEIWFSKETRTCFLISKQGEIKGKLYAF